MRRPAPIIHLLHQVRVERNDLRGQLAACLEELDRTRADLAVERRRTRRWKGAAFEMAPRVKGAMEILLMQQQSDELADLPETTETFPRSIP